MTCCISIAQKRRAHFSVLLCSVCLVLVDYVKATQKHSRISAADSTMPYSTIFLLFNIVQNWTIGKMIHINSLSESDREVIARERKKKRKFSFDLVSLTLSSTLRQAGKNLCKINTKKAKKKKKKNDQFSFLQTLAAVHLCCVREDWRNRCFYSNSLLNHFVQPNKTRTMKW